MARRVFVTGLGVVSAAGIGIEPLWAAVTSGQSKLAPITSFDPAGFDVRIAGEVADFKANKIVPKSYRKATKVMARDIELAVGAADGAVRNAGLITPGIESEQPRTYEGPRTGAHIGAGLIAAELDELAGALASSRDAGGKFDIHHWGGAGMMNLTPLWLLKYLPNMLACHVTIIHDCQGPSNTITCGEASGGLSIAESVRVLQRDKADLCFCGGAESKINPMAFYRQIMTGRLSGKGEVKPFDQSASGTLIGEGGGIITIEAQDTLKARGGRAYAAILGYGASMSLSSRSGIDAEPDGEGLAGAMMQALADASVKAGDISAIVAYGSGNPAHDRGEAAALKRVFGQAIPATFSSKPYIGNCGAGAGGIDVAIGCKMIAEQVMPAVIGCETPIDGMSSAKSAASHSATINHVLVVSTSLGGQNVAIVLGRV
ncbi:MAG: beta-ketoacyl synthase N-terminal-like domain-containing protein [Phycisphaeraceae bacterium]